MKKIDYCIVGGGIAGTSAAETIREIDKRGSIAIVCAEPHRLYSRVMLSKAHYILGQSTKERVYLRPKDHYINQSIDTIFSARAEHIDVQKKIISLSTGEKINYKKLLIATGGTAKTLICRGANLHNVFPLQNLYQTHAIMDAMKNVTTIVVVGNGFIGFELASIFKEAGKRVTLIIRKQRFWQKVLSKEASAIIENGLKKQEIVLIKNSEVVEILGNESVEKIRLSTNMEISCGLLVYGIGTVYRQSWLEDSGIEQNKGVLANEFLQTSIKDIWAGGDCVEYPEALARESFMAGNWDHAEEQGKYVGTSMVTVQRKPFSYVSSYTSFGVGLVVSFIGDVYRGDIDKCIYRGGKELYPKYGELFIKNNSIRGAILINRGNEIVSLRKIIAKRMDITLIKKNLEDPSFDLKSLL